MDGFHSPAIFAAAPVAVAITLGAYVVSMALQLLALARIPAAVAGLTFCAEPLFASLFAALILGERLAGLQYLGAVIVLAAIAINAARSAGTGRA
jgi:drug/metabolite transporter (DMT)-like permease